MRAKSCGSNSFGSDHGYFRGGNVRDSLNQLRISINRSLILPCIDNDPEENLHIDENDVKELRLQIDNIKEESENGGSTLLYSAEGCETDFTCEHYLSCSEDGENEEEINSGEPLTETELSKTSISIDPPSAVLEDPVLSESPKIQNSQRRSLVFSSNHLSIHDDAVETCKNLDVIRQSHQPENIRSSLRASRVFAGPTESLEASLHRGLQIIDYHQRNSAPARSSVSFSFEHLALKPCISADNINDSAQTSSTLVTKVCFEVFILKSRLHAAISFV